jgi:hypothetical protein
MLDSEFYYYGLLEVGRKELVSIGYELPRYTVKSEAPVDYCCCYLRCSKCLFVRDEMCVFRKSINDYEYAIVYLS